MILSEEQLRAATHGAVRVLHEGGFTGFRRFTEEQEACYAAFRRPQQAGYVRCSAGIRLAFRTNSASVAFDYRMDHCGTGCRYGCIDVTADGENVGFFGDSDGMPIEGRAEAALGGGEKLVEIWLPWARDGWLRGVELADGASFAPVAYERRLLLYGDSITHGCDARHPAQNYAALLAKMLGAEFVNKGIGGDIFFPELLDCAEPFAPDIVTAAYGTNDWNGQLRTRTEQGCLDFYSKLSAKFPAAEIFAVSPIWRGDHTRETKFGEPAEAVETLIRRVCAELPNVHVVSGWGLVPHDESMFGDKYLHPNEAGFAEYARNLHAAIADSLSRLPREGSQHASSHES